MKAVNVNMHEAKTHLSRLIAKVQKGQEVVIAKAGKPVARLLPVEPPLKPRKPGSSKGKIWVADDFADPLPDDIVDLFENGQIFPSKSNAKPK